MKVHINPGICGLETEIFLEKNSNSTVTIKGETQCPYVKKYIKLLHDIDPIEEVFKTFDNSIIYKNASKTLQHLACPVPCAVVKLIEADSSLALPKDISIRFNKEE